MLLHTKIKLMKIFILINELEIWIFKMVHSAGLTSSVTNYFIISNSSRALGWLLRSLAINFFLGWPPEKNQGLIFSPRTKAKLNNKKYLASKYCLVIYGALGRARTHD